MDNELYEKAARKVIAAAKAEGYSLDKVDVYSVPLREEFLKRFRPEALKSIAEHQLLSSLFIGVSVYKDSMSNYLRYTLDTGFGKLGGYSQQFGLYWDSKLGWTENGSTPISKEKALEKGKIIRDNLLACCDAVSECIKTNRLETPNDYENLLNDIQKRHVDSSFAVQKWVRKYLYIIYPDYFISLYNEKIIKSLLDKLKIGPSSSVYGDIGHILLLEKAIAELAGVDRDAMNGRIGSLIWNVRDSVELLRDPPDTPGGENLNGEEPEMDKIYETGIEPEWKRNRIMFGAPGTGKSYLLNQDKDDLLNIKYTDDEKPDPRVERVIFYPDYSYANFVGTYKPVSFKDEDGNESIRYTYVPGPFMRTYIKAWNDILTGDNPQPYLLIIEEINRANAAAVFGDIFQLLDRKGNGYSEYSIQASEDIRRYLRETEEWDEEYCTELRMPDNMFIWATMNSADQGVFPMDTAFKRRWNFEYLDINDVESKLPEYWVTLGSGADAKKVEWHSLRMAINDWMADNGINEDKQIGPYFISKLPSASSETEKTAKFNEIFTNKIIMYLFEDAAKQRRYELFSNCLNKNRYSLICKDFRERGISIFNEEIQGKVRKA